MRANAVKQTLSVIILAVLALTIVGCDRIRHIPDKKLPELFTDSPIVSVRYYHKDPEGIRFEDLDENRLDEFIDDLYSMEIEAGGMLDYQGSSFGIEMELEDGNYLTYDGTYLALRSSKIIDEQPTAENEIEGNSNFIYVLNCEFWDVMKGYFPSIEENGDQVYSRSAFHH